MLLSLTNTCLRLLECDPIREGGIHRYRINGVVDVDLRAGLEIFQSRALDCATRFEFRMRVHGHGLDQRPHNIPLICLVSYRRIHREFPIPDRHHRTSEGIRLVGYFWIRSHENFFSRL